MRIDIANQKGTRLLTTNTICREDINVVPVLQEKNAAENGEVAPDEGYAGLSKVTVDVPIPDGYIQPSGSLEITENGTYDATNYASVSVNTPEAEAVEEYDGSITVS